MVQVAEAASTLRGQHLPMRVAHRGLLRARARRTWNGSKEIYNYKNGLMCATKLDISSLIIACA